MQDLDIIKTLWPIIAAIAALAGTVMIWALRTEGRLNHVEKTQATEGERMAKAMEKMGETQEKMADAISEMRTTLAGVVGYEKGREDRSRARK